MAVELATAYIALVPSLKGASQKISEQLSPAAASSGAEAGNHMGRSLVDMAAKWAAPLAAAAGFGAVLKTGFDEAKDAAAGTAQLAAGIASTGNAAHVSVDGLNGLASSIQNYSGQTDDSIVKSEQLLLTFTNIKNNGPDKIFDQATKASADMAAKFGGDASQQAVLLGKALNDPVKGISALQRVGVSFTASQKNTIAALVKTGDVAGAQKVILKELNTEFGGAAKAAGESFPGQLQRVHRAFEDLSQGVVQGFLPVMGPALEGVITILQKVAPVAAAMSQHVADGLAKVGSAFGAVFNLFKTGNFTGSMRKALGVEEDSKIVGIILGIRDGVRSGIGGIKAGYELLTTGKFTGGIRKALGVEEDSKLVGVILGIRDTFQNVTGAVSVFFSGLTTGSSVAIGWMGMFSDAGAKIHGMWSNLTGAVSVFFSGLTTGSSVAIGWMGTFSDAGAKLHGVWNNVSGAVSVFFSGLTTGSSVAEGWMGKFSAAGAKIHGAFGSINFGAIFGGIASTVGPLVSQFFALWGALSPVQLIFKSIAPFLPQLLGVFGQLAMVIGGTLGTALKTLLPAFLQLQGVFVKVFQQVLAIVLPVVVRLVTMLGQTLTQLVPIVVPIITKIATLAGTLIAQLAPILMRLISAVMPMVITIFGALLSAIGPVIQIIAGLLVPVIQALMPVVVTVFGVIANVITTVMQIIMGIIQVVTGIITGNWSMVWEGIKNVFSGIWNTIVAVVTGVFAIIWSIISSALNFWFNLISSVLGNIGKFFSGTWNNITRGISDFVGGIGKFFAGIPGTIQGALSGAASWLYNSGRDIVNGLFDGIKSLASTIGNFFLGLLPGWIVQPFKLALGIQSPSRVFRAFGKNIGEGLMLGTGDTKDDVSASMRDLVTVPDAPTFGASTAAMNAGTRIGQSPIYVQNPFTGDYLLARVGSVADSRVSAADSQSTYVRPGRR